MDDNLRFTVVSTIGKKIPADKMVELEERLEDLDKKDVTRLNTLNLKEPWVTLLISFFLGGYGVDRFFIGDTRMGVIKLLLTLTTVIMGTVGSSIAYILAYTIIGLVIAIPLLIFIFALSIAQAIVVYADIYFSYKKTKEKNWEQVEQFLNRSEKRKEKEKEVKKYDEYADYEGYFLGK